jgi:phytoene desaturase
MKKVLVIGSGFSSLSAACYLARDGYEVTVVEKNAHLGGRARQLQAGGFTFDMGPTWYWMPDVFERFFADFGKTPSDYYTLRRLDPSYRVVFGQDDFVDVPADRAGQEELFERIEPGSARRLRAFLEEAEHIYRVTVTDMVYRPGRSPMELVTADVLQHLHLFTRSLRRHVRKKFSDPRLLKILEFPVLFLGAKPQDIPAFYSFMNYADFGLGTWYPDGGMQSVVDGIVALARSLGVTFRTSQPVQRFFCDGRSVRGVVTSEGLLPADLVVSGADYQHTEQLLVPALRTYSETYWQKRTFAPSALLFYIGLDKKLDNVLHHTLFFDEDFDAHASAIYDTPSWPQRPLFYVSIPSRTDAAAAPAGQEALMILVPLAPGIADSEALREQSFGAVLERLERLTGQDIRRHIVYRQSYGIDDFSRDYHAYKGNAYGLANTLSQTAFLRPSIRSRRVRNLFFTGQLTVPGPGVPPALISGKIAAGEIRKNFPQNESVIAAVS